MPGPDRLLTITEAADMLNTKPRFAQRLVTERRIRFTHVGRHVRIPESAVRDFIDAGMVQPVTTARRRGRRAA
jgi:excisionase family DNA binding protein